MQTLAVGCTPTFILIDAAMCATAQALAAACPGVAHLSVRRCQHSSLITVKCLGLFLAVLMIMCKLAGAYV